MCVYNSCKDSGENMDIANKIIEGILSEIGTQKGWMS